jgi:hypothetical protein
LEASTYVGSNAYCMRQRWARLASILNDSQKLDIEACQRRNA